MEEDRDQNIIKIIQKKGNPFLKALEIFEKMAGRPPTDEERQEILNAYRQKEQEESSSS